MNPIEVTCTLTSADHQTYYDQRARSFNSAYQFPLICFIVSLIWLIAHDPQAGLSGILIVSAVWMFLIWRGTIRMWSSWINKVSHQPFAIEISEETFVWKTQDRRWETRWTAIRHLREDKHLFYLMGERKAEFWFPKRILSEEQQIGLRRIFAASHPDSDSQRAIGFPVIISERATQDQ